MMFFTEGIYHSVLRLVLKNNRYVVPESFLTQELLDTPAFNDGAILSEFLSSMVISLLGQVGGCPFFRCVSEGNIPRSRGSKMTDYLLMTSKGEEVAVSVTRAMHTPKKQFLPEEADRLLRKKLRCVLESSRDARSIARCRKNADITMWWKVQILHILCQTSEIAVILSNVYNTMNDAEALILKKNVPVILTVAPYASIYVSRPLQLVNYDSDSDYLSDSSESDLETNTINILF